MAHTAGPRGHDDCICSNNVSYAPGTTLERFNL
ncbi:hypothetical protein EV192_106583 [Actinocrispum wychmicini]|uniref:Uncharacterized protein n=1 Tax=Actinocrispum wychmicini TaxID=1213861 RepID=A0A4R2JJC2_9PSEU|nr:hypothetical protein EV192_106583 [Actinocrispum wychmicini]